MRKHIGEIKLIKAQCDTHAIAEILRKNGYIVIFTEDAEITRTYQLFKETGENKDEL